MIKPMLAYKVGKKEVDWSEKVFIQPKLDGVRCIFTKDGAYSRTGKEFKNVAHIKHDLTDFFSKNPNSVLDGELYNHDLKNDFEKIISLVRKQKPTEQDAREAQNIVQYHVYDTVAEGPDYESRFNWLRINLPIATSITLIKNTVVGNQDEAKMLHKPYECKRSYNLQKFKDFHDTEATIIGYVPGKGKFTGLIGKFLMRDDNGIEFGCPIGKGYNFDDRRYILNNVNKYIGKRATFTYFERTKANSYRHPLYKTLRNYE
jgi:DNA ligase-1